MCRGRKKNKYNEAMRLVSDWRYAYSQVQETIYFITLFWVKLTL